jgi:inner membrane protein ybhL
MEQNTQTISLKQANESVRRKFMNGVYGWMMLALAVSGIAAFVTANTSLVRVIYGNPIVPLALVVVELILVGVLSLRIRSMSFGTAVGTFIAYSLVNGLTLASIFLVYASSSIAQVFFVSALMFGGMSLYGMKTKSDLRSAGRYLFMALIGIIIASLVNVFLRSSGLDWLISIIAVVVFTGLTAYDTQKLMTISVYSDGSDNFKKVAVIGALQLYLDFINIFLSLLRLFGKRR